MEAGFTYSGDEAPALHDIDLSLPAGSLTAVLGPVGAGTSTLCRVLAGLAATRGTLTGRIETTGTTALLGDDPEAQLSGMTSCVADETQLACRLRGVPPAEAERRARQALSRLGLEHLWHRQLPTLSGGQRQLTALARISAAEPELLILDQPTQSLDPDMRRRVMSLLRTFTDRGGTVLVTGHQIDELTGACDETRVLDAGRLLPGDSSAQATGVWDSRPSIANDRVGLADSARSPVESAVAPVPSATAPSPAAAAPALAARGPSALTVKGLSVTRSGDRILDGLDLEVDSGELVTVSGANGAGKSTLLRALIGLLERSAHCTGEIKVSHLGEVKDLTDLPAHMRAAHVGWVGQDPGTQLSAASVRSELLHAAPLPRHSRRDRGQVREQRNSLVDEVLEATGLSAVAGEHPFDLDVPRRKDVVIATALITGTRVLLLDEPTIGRDRAGMLRLNAIMERFLARGGAVVATTHDRRWAQETSHRLLRLDHGRAEPSGNGELMTFCRKDEC